VKILFAAPLGVGQTSQMRMRALQRLGHEVIGVHTNEPWIRASWMKRQIQRRLQRGSAVDEVNDSVLRAADVFSPDMVWAEKQEFLRPETMAALRAKGARLVHFTPDPYFSVDWKRTRLMDDAMAAFDVLVYCKSYERDAYAALGQPLVYMPLGYCDEVHRPVPSHDARWTCAVGFLGGWEPRRERLLHAIAAAGGDLKIFGGYWDFLHDGKWSPRRAIILKQLAGQDHFEFHRDDLLSAAHQGGEVYGDDYARALTGAAIGLGFLRRVCPDQHTTRTFEIPACGSMLLADRTAEHQAFFEEGQEAEYFDTAEELVDKVRFYTRNDDARRRIAQAGRERAVDSRYAYIHRLGEALADVAEKLT
jgi:spore maturation protein CgeB